MDKARQKQANIIQYISKFCMISRDFARFRILRFIRINPILLGETSKEDKTGKHSTRVIEILNDSEGFCEILRNSARFCEILRDSAKFCEILRDSARLCKILRGSEF